MWIQVRSFDGKTSVRIDGLSKLTKVEDLREKLVETFEAPPDRQRLFYRGKQLVDGHTLFDYDVGLNEIVQIMVRPAVPAVLPVEENGSGNESSMSDKENTEPESMEAECSTCDEHFEECTYKVGDIVDCRDPTMGAWFEGRIIKITKATDEDTTNENQSQNSSEGQSSTVVSSSDATKAEQYEMKSDENSQALTNRTNNETEKDNSFTNSTEEDSKQEKSNETDVETNCETLEQPLVNGVDSNLVNGDTDKPIETAVADDGYIYHVKYEGYEEDDPEKLRSCNIRPRCSTIIPLKNVEIGDKVMVNFNYDEPTARGYWYDGIITNKRDTRTIKELYATVYIGADLMPLKDCKLLFIYEIYKIEKPGVQINLKDHDEKDLPKIRPTKPECDYCQDKESRKCKQCGCHKCGGKNDPHLVIMCDECDMGFHLGCLDPPLENVPDEEEWYCPLCKNDDSKVVKAGEKLKASKKKSKMASQVSQSSRDWGKGMACVGRTKMCTIVPPNHFGPVPGIEVGSLWKFRVQASEAGVHRPHVAGIHGREDEGAYSIVLSGGYEDDVDDGESFTYTGSGGRDLSGNKRTAEQSCDQTLTRMNKALAKNCNAPIDNKKGAEAKDWKAGKPVRVIRNAKGRKHSKYAPEEGNRYDGIYKIAKYWPDKGQSGFVVWRYLLRRDDVSPAPWTKAGKKRITELGLTIQYPEGYLESQKEKEESAEKGDRKGKKRKIMDSDTSPGSTPDKKKKAAAYKIAADIKKLIKEDNINKKIWDEASTFTKEGGQKFHAKVEELFLCICCQDLVYQPITTKCQHNICKSCLMRSFKAEVHSCPACRTELGKDYSTSTNKTLKQILNGLFPGYENGR